MKSRTEIHQHIVSVMSKLFEIEESEITEDALLYDDLDIDSIDAVDLIVELKNFTGKKIAPEEFKSVRTVGDIVTAVQDLINSD